MEEKDPLFEYIKIIKDVGEYLARGNEITTPNYTVINFDECVALQDGAMSLEETELCDTLECTYYNELGSIKRIIDIINECDIKKLQAEISQGISKEIDLATVPEEYKKAYKIIQGRLREILNSIVLKLFIGIRIIPTDLEIAIIEHSNWKAKDCYDQNEYEEDLLGDEEDTDYERSYKSESDEFKENGQEIEKPYLIYSTKKKKFYLMREREIVSEDVNADLAMEIVVGYMYRTEREKALEELKNGQANNNKIKYEGMNIFIDEGHEEL